MSTATHVETIDTARPGVPLGRLVKVELRKMFDTRSGFWLMASIAIICDVATIGVILFVAGRVRLTFGAFAPAIGFPIAILLPIMAILSVTGEWSQRTGLITFTLVPHRSQVILAKAITAVLVGLVSMLLAFAIGAVGNIVGSALNGVGRRVGHVARRLPADHPGQHPRPAGRLHARRADPQHGGGDRRLLRVLASSCRDLRSPGRVPGLVQGHPARGSTSAPLRHRCSTGARPR